MTNEQTRITVRHNNESFGPFGLEQINSLLVAERIENDDLAWIEGTEEWVKLSTIPGVIIVPPRPQQSPQSPSNHARKRRNGNTSDRMILPAFLLAFFLGMFGAHRFYVGKTGSAIVMLGLTVTLVGAFISAIWHIVDWIMIITGNFRDENDKLLTEWT